MSETRELPGVLARVVADGDVVLTMGAGDIGAVAPRLAAGGLAPAPGAAA